MSVISAETRMIGLPYGEEIMIVGRTAWTQSTSVTDRQTDKRRERITITKTVQRKRRTVKMLYHAVEDVTLDIGMKKISNVHRKRCIGPISK